MKQTNFDDLDADFIVNLLQTHNEDRKRKEWKLYPIKSLFLKNESEKEQYFHFPAILEGQYQCTHFRKYSLVPQKSYDELYFKNYVYEVFDFCPNNMVIAGGAVGAIFRHNYYMIRPKVKDVDFFFYEMTVDQTVTVINNILKFCLTKYQGRVMFTRNRNVTSIFIKENQEGPYIPFEYKTRGFQMQFIHRVFPNLSSVIGGFDISASMYLMTRDGEIYTNLMGLFTFRTNVIPVDISSASASFGNRLAKYHHEKDYNLFFLKGIGDTLPQEIKRMTEILGVQGLDRINIKLGEQFFASLNVYDDDPDRTRHLYKMSEQHYKHYISDYDPESFLLEIDVSNTIELIKGNFDTITSLGFSLDDMDNGAEIMTEKHFINSFSYILRSKSAKKCIPKDIKSPESLLNFYRSLIKKYKNCQELSNPAIIGMDDNPGRQFTASFHPTKPSEWYNHHILSDHVYKIGIPDEVFALLALAKKHGHELFGRLSNDTFRYLLNTILVVIADENKCRIEKRLLTK